MRPKYARMIRAGIMAKCRPLIRTPEGYKIVDMSRLWEFQMDWALNNHHELSRKAYERTDLWYSVRQK